MTACSSTHVASLCPVCGQGELRSQKVAREFEISGKKVEIFLCMSTCSFCLSETADNEQSVLNRRELIRARKQIEALPLGCQIRQMRQNASLTQVAAGILFGGGPTAFSKYENDDLVPDVAMSNLLWLAINHPEIVGMLQVIKSRVSSTVLQLTSESSFFDFATDDEFSVEWADDSESDSLEEVPSPSVSSLHTLQVVTTVSEPWKGLQ